MGAVIRDFDHSLGEAADSLGCRVPVLGRYPPGGDQCRLSHPRYGHLDGWNPQQRSVIQRAKLFLLNPQDQGGLAKLQ